MPQAYAAIAYAVAANVVLQQILVAVFLTVLQKALQKKPARGAFAQNVTIRSTIAERHLIIGTARATGAILFYGTSGSGGTFKYLWYVVAYATHQCSALKDCWLDKAKIPAADINGTTGAVATAVYSGKLKIWDHLGTGAQTVDTNIDAEFTEWTANHRLRGVCYRVLRFERDSDAWPSGAPQMVTSLVDGALLYDPRLDSTNGGSGSHRASNPSTWAFSHNWALGVRWFLSGGSVVNDQSTRMIKFGVQESDSRIDDAYTIAAANIADQSLSGANAPPSGAQARYTLDIEVSCGQLRRDILEELLMCGGPGQLVYVHGKWRIYAAAYDAPVHTFTQDDLVGQIESDDTSGDEDRFNTVSAVHIDASKDYGEATCSPRTNASYITQDASQTIPREIQIRGCSDTYRAQRICELVLRDSRQMRVVKFPFGRQGLKVAPWETFSFSHTAFAWSGRVFRCIERDVQRTDDGGMTCVITGKATASSVYTDLITADYTTGTSATNSLQSDLPDPPTALTATGHPRAIEFNWTLGAFWEQNGISELWEYTSQTPFASATRIWTGRGTRAVIAKSLNDNVIRYYWVRVRTIGGQVSTTEPATNGLAASANVERDVIVPDPEFALATDNRYWYRADPGGGTSASIVASGGIVAGYVTIPTTGSSQPHYVVSRRERPYQCGTGEFYTVTVRARKVAGTHNGVFVAGVMRHDQDPAGSTFDVSIGVAGIGGLRVAGIVFSTSWIELSALCMVQSTTGYVGGDLPFLSAYAGQESTVSGTIEFDLVQVQPGLNCPPYPVTYTAGATLTSADLLTGITYDSVSAGTLTLPSASANYIGAFIDFEQKNSGLLTIGQPSGQTLQSPVNTTGNRAVAGRYSKVRATVVDVGVWRLTGDL
jgi:hypothetical protein